jgi:hypothetical protein
MKQIEYLIDYKLLILPLIVLVFLSIILIGCNKEVSVTPPEPTPQNGKLFVSSDPLGSFIYLNGKNTGNVTPDTINWLDEGTYVLTLKRKLFKDFSTTIKINPDSINTFFLDYHTVSDILGTLYMDSSPREAEIFLNGVSTGKKTLAIIENIFPGTYEVTLKRSGFWDGKLFVDIESGKTIYPFVKLTDSLTWVNFNTTNSELPDDFINHVAVEKGIIKWIATASGGLARFDDNSWSIFNTSNSPLPSNNIRYIGIDKLNRKWICVESDLIVYDDINWKIYNSTNSNLPNNNLRCVAFDSRNDAWIGTFGGGIAHFDGIHWEIFNTENSLLRTNLINTVAVDQNDVIWIGTYDEGIARFDRNIWTIYHNFKSGIEKNATNIAIDLNNTPWVAISQLHQAPGGSSYFDGQSWQSTISLPSNYVLYIGVDAQNQKWFCNESDGLTKLINNTWVYYTTSNSRIPNDRVFAVAFDGAGNKWIATYGGGLTKYKGN